MTQIIIDAGLRCKLHDLKGPLELCDETGRVLARVTPVYDSDEYAPLEPQVTQDELKRREQSDRWYSTQQVLDHLKELEN